MYFILPTKLDDRNTYAKIFVLDYSARFALRSNKDPYFLLLIASTTLMKAPHIAPENER